MRTDDDAGQERASAKKIKPPDDREPWAKTSSDDADNILSTTRTTAEGNQGRSSALTNPSCFFWNLA
jgi:hypothetical protein